METLLKLATTKTTLTLHKYSTFTKYFHVMVCSELLWQPVSDNYHKALYLRQFEKNEKKKPFENDEKVVRCAKAHPNRAYNNKRK